LIRKASPFLAAALLAYSLGSAAAFAQTETPETPLVRQLHRLDLGVSGIGIFNTTVTGPVVPLASNTGQSIKQFGSNTLGALVSIGYTAKPYIGFEFNYGYARYTENYTGAGSVTCCATNDFQIQTQADEFTLGYVAHPPHPVFGLQPFLGAGAGSIEFKPTAHGGEGADKHARAVYYYSAGVQKDITPNFGLRAGFRELFFLDPDYGLNYLTILKHANTFEPSAGFYLRY
jgi:opacity protein-like surface antigen